MDEPKKILVVGDVMVDKYIYAMTSRQAPEAPIPVWDEVAHELRLGGAANVANNLKALGGEEVEVFLAGIVGLTDRKMISRAGINTILCSGTETMYKTRYIDAHSKKHMFRVDNIRTFSSDSKRQFVRSLRHFLRGHKFDAIIFSDYDKETINPEVMELVNPVAGLAVVDSKRVDLSMYRGAQLLKINEHEYATQLSRGPYLNVESLFDYVVVTHGAKGAELRQHEVTKSDEKRYMVHSENFPVESVKVQDVTGCGDTHTAAMTFSLLKNQDVRLAVRFANACSRNVVQKFGTSVSDASLASLGV